MAGGMPWVKVYTEMLDDPKLAKIDDVIKWRFVELILVAAECDAGGAFIVGDSEMTIDDIAWRLRMDKTKLSSEIGALIKAGILHKDGSILEIPKFAERQGPTQKEKRETWKARQQKRRERVTRESLNPDDAGHALEKSREDKNREEEEETLPPLPDNCKYWEDEISPLTPTIANFIDLNEKELSKEYVHDAIYEAVSHNARSLAYVKKVLETWRRDGKRKNPQRDIKPVMAWKVLDDGTQVPVEVSHV